MQVSTERLATTLLPAIRALRSQEDARARARLNQAVTDDGRPRLDRATGELPRAVHVPMDAVSVRADPTTVSVNADVQAQLDDQAEALVAATLQAVDTASLDTTIAEVGAVTQISGVVVTGGHSHASGTFQYQGKALTATQTINPGAMASHSTQNFPITVTGAQLYNVADVGPPSSVPDGILWGARVTATNTVTLRVINITAASVTVPSGLWRVSAFV